MDLQMEFPAILAHKTAVSKAIGNFLRSCMQNSVGPERFHRIITELHHKQHNTLELQYLISEYRKRNGIGQYFQSSSFSPTSVSQFDDKFEYAGYVSSGVYLRILYTQIIETLRPKMDKYLKNSLEKMRDAYVDYGHEMPVVFFTDNVNGDQDFLKTIFGSLKTGVESVTRNSINNASTNMLKLPKDIKIEYIQHSFEKIETEISDLMEKIEAFLATEEVHTVFDCEWHMYSPDNVIDVV